MSRLGEINTWDSQHTRSMSSPRDASAPYVLVADADRTRADECLNAIARSKVRAIVVPDGDEAIGVLQRHGPPLLLVVDLSLPGKDGFAVAGAIASGDRGRVAIIAWSSRREHREFAAHRFAGLNARVLSGSVARAVLRGAIEAALPPRAIQQTVSDSSTATAAEDLHESMAALAAKAQRLCGTAGVAVYLRGPSDPRFRTSVTWTSDAPIPHSPDFLPSVVDAVLATRDAFFRSDLTTQPLPAGTTPVRGLAAVPLVDVQGQIVGALCVFDLKPLAFGAAVVDALRALGRGVSVHRALRSASAPVEAATLPTVVTPSNIAVPSLQQNAPTALLEREHGDVAIARELSRMRRERRQLSVILFDVGAAGVTDEGTGSPNEAIETVSDTLPKAIRGSDLAIRWAHNAMLVVLPGLGVMEARPVAERVRAAIQAGARHRLAVSGGVAEFLPDEPFESVVARADERVREARERGHNRVA